MEYEGKEVKLRWLDIDSESAMGSLLLNEKDAQDMRLKMLARLRIELRPGESPLQSWVRAMSEENGLPVQFPAVAPIAQMVMENSALQRFVFFLA